MDLYGSGSDMTNLDSVSDEQVDEIYDRVRDSFELAMEAEGVDAERREAILGTVDDSVGNEF